MFKKYILLLLFISLAVEAEPQTLDDVIVYASSVGKGSNIENTDISTTIISKEQIQSSPESTLDQILNKQVGIWTSHTSSLQIEPTTPTVGIRGFGNSSGEKVLFMVDGIPMNDGYFKTIDWNLVPKDTIERVEIVRGGGHGVLWGNLAEGGVINVITREPSDNEKKIGFGYGSFNTKTGDASATIFKNDVLKISANANVIDTDGYNSAPKEFRSNQKLTESGTTVHNGLVSFSYKPTDAEKYFLKLNVNEVLQDHLNYDVAKNSWYKYDARTGGEIKLNDTKSFNYNSFFNYSNLDKTNGSLVNVNGSRGLSPNFGVLNSILNADTMPSQFESANYQSYGGSAFINDKIENSFITIRDIKYGFDIRGTQIQDSNSLTTQTRNTSNDYYVSSIFDIKGQNMFEGVFAQGTWSPNDTPLDVTLGIRHDWWQAYSGETTNEFYNSPIARVNPGMLKSSGVMPTPNHDFNQFNPRLGIKYSLNDVVDLRAAVYRNFAAPGMNYQYRTSASGGYVQLGNPELEPETNFGKEIGIDFKTSTTKTQFTLFHNSLSNLINTMNVCGTAGLPVCDMNYYGLSGSGITQVKQSMNVGDAVMEGGEIFTEWKATDYLTLNASASKTIAFIDKFNSTFSSLNNENSPLLYASRQIQNVPDVVLTFGGSYNITKDLTATWLVKNWNKYYMGTVPNSTYVNDGATTADIGLSYKAYKGLTLYANGTNISNSYYIAKNRNGSSGTAAEIGMPRAIFGGFTYSF